MQRKGQIQDERIKSGGGTAKSGGGTAKKCTLLIIIPLRAYLAI